VASEAVPTEFFSFFFLAIFSFSLTKYHFFVNSEDVILKKVYFCNVNFIK
jgi:hypothetical protein